jgi:hypothetical protein
LEERLELVIPDLQKTSILKTDASEAAIGAVLIHENKPVAYILRLLNQSERNYGITDK